MRKSPGKPRALLAAVVILALTGCTGAEVQPVGPGGLTREDILAIGVGLPDAEVDTFDMELSIGDRFEALQRYSPVGAVDPASCGDWHLARYLLSSADDSGSQDAFVFVSTSVRRPDEGRASSATVSARVFPSPEAAAAFLNDVANAAAACPSGYRSDQTGYGPTDDGLETFGYGASTGEVSHEVVRGPSGTTVVRVRELEVEQIVGDAIGISDDDWDFVAYGNVVVASTTSESYFGRALSESERDQLVSQIVEGLKAASTTE